MRTIILFMIINLSYCSIFNKKEDRPKEPIDYPYIAEDDTGYCFENQ